MAGRVQSVVIRLNGGSAYLTDPRFIGFKEVPIEAFLRDPKLAWLVDETQAEAWDLRTADRVVVSSDDGRIVSVNGLTDSAASASRPRYSELVNTPGGRPQYPPQEWPLLDHSQELVVRALQLLAPIGPGSQAFLAGPYGTGKTRASRAAAEALLRIAMGQGNMAFVVLQVGERRVDVQPMEAILGQYTGQIPIYQFVSVLGETGPQATVNLCQVALETVKRLYEMGYHVVYVVDSLAGLATEGYIPTTPQGSPLTRGGVSEYALTQIKRHVAVAGYGGPERSVTGIYTALRGEPGSRAGGIFDEAGGPQSSTVWEFGNFAGIDFPKIDLRSHSREIERMLQSERLELHRRLEKIVNNVGATPEDRNPVRRLAELLRYAKTSGTFAQAYAVWRTWWRDEKKPAAERRREVAQRLFEEAGAALAQMPNRAAAVFDLLKAAGIGERTEAVKLLVAALSEPEREQLTDLLRKDGLAPTAPTGDPLENFLAAADVLKNSGGDLHAAVKQSLARMGLPLWLLMDQSSDPSDPVERMKALLDLVAGETGRKFKKRDRWAKELVERGFVTPENLEDEEALGRCEVYRRLKGKEGRPGETMEALLSAGPHPAGSKKKP